MDIDSFKSEIKYNKITLINLVKNFHVIYLVLEQNYQWEQKLLHSQSLSPHLLTSKLSGDS